MIVHVLMIMMLLLQIETSYQLRNDSKHVNRSLSDVVKHEAVRSVEEDYNDDDGGKPRIFLQVSQMKNMSVVSDDTVQIKCKVDAYPNDSIRYDWRFENLQYVHENKKVIDDNRISVVNRSKFSKLKINFVKTVDQGWYYCEVSNKERRETRKTYLKVSFKLPPPHKPILPKGRCEVYRGMACREILYGRKVFIDPATTQEKIEGLLSMAFNRLNSDGSVPATCSRFAHPAFCYFFFAPCDPNTLPGADAVDFPLCKRDCEAMKYDVCGDVIDPSDTKSSLKDIFSDTECSHLPNKRCTSLDLPVPVNCYNNSGVSYRGRSNLARSGKHCVVWPSKMASKFFSLAGGHNFCRNPGNERSMPWCFTDSNYRKKEACDVDRCESQLVSDKKQESNLALIIIPTVCLPFIVGCVLFAVCFCRRSNKTKSLNQSSGTQITNNQRKETGHVAAEGASVVFKKQTWKVAELNANSVMLVDEMGEGQFGKVYRANVIPNPAFCTISTVAVKTLSDVSHASQEEEFLREINIFSDLQHNNIACLKALVMQPTLRCMIFEYTAISDLHEFVVLRSPQSDFAPLSPSGGSQASSLIEPNDFIHMAAQIACGMDYLTTKNFVHRDLAARNVLVCTNNQMKISNLAIVRDSYLSCYYRSPQGGQMLPIRWMAPESLQSWQFSDKSAVWSFGVLLWEVFGYGMQPYCGYSNHEVLEMIRHRQLLDCPDQCPAKVYSLMMECWCEQSFHRPTFKELLVKLQGWEQQNTTRMTSHLIQGINRGTGFQPYQQTSFTSNPLNFNHQQSTTFHRQPQPNNYPHNFTSSHQPFQSYTSPSSVFPPPYNQRQPINQETEYPSNAMPFTERRQQQPYRPGPPSHSSITSSASSSRSVRNNQQRVDYRADSGLTTNNYSYTSHQPRTLSDVAENEIAPTANISLINKNEAVTSKLKPNVKRYRGDSSDVSTVSFKATSCDSGLPVDEVADAVNDARTPLMMSSNERAETDVKTSPSTQKPV